METNTVLSLIGLGLALIELYVPKLSTSLESWMNALVRPLLVGAEAVKDTPARILAGLDSFTIKTRPGLLFVGLPALVLAIVIGLITQWSQGTGESILVVLFVISIITLIPLTLSIAFRLFGGYLAYPLYGLALIIASPAWLIKLANRMGNGKGVSGFGLLLAFYGVIVPVFT